MLTAKVGDCVRVSCLGKLDDDSVFGSPTNATQVEFTIGAGRFIRGFEAPVVGMSPGESRTARVAAADAYGPRKKALVVQLDRSRISPNVSRGKKAKEENCQGRSHDRHRDVRIGFHGDGRW